jgi:pyroglutamyl-peptidase
MARVLLTAFDAYDTWSSNASWLTLIEITRELPTEPRVVTRRYPVDFEQLPERLEHDIDGSYDYVILLGQAPGSTEVRLETIGINRGVRHTGGHLAGQPLVPDGPLAYATGMDVEGICQRVRAAGIPCSVSFHAGTYLCNAALYLSLHQIAKRKLPCDALFVHMPLTPGQAAAAFPTPASLPATVSAEAIRILLACLPKTEVA